MRRCIYTFMVITLLLGNLALASSPVDILGVWNNGEKSARIEMIRCGSSYCGRIVWLKEQNYSPRAQEGAPGSPRMDSKNPNPEKRNAPLLGLQIVNDMRPDGEGTWSGGTVYDPKNGKTYKGKMTLVG